MFLAHGSTCLCILAAKVDTLVCMSAPKGAFLCNIAPKRLLDNIFLAPKSAFMCILTAKSTSLCNSTLKRTLLCITAPREHFCHVCFDANRSL